eukprot:48088-Pelagomonas_calceolata.AAC.4
MACAGLYDVCTGPDGAPLYTFTICTTDSSSRLQASRVQATEYGLEAKASSPNASLAVWQAGQKWVQEQLFAECGSVLSFLGARLDNQMQPLSRGQCPRAWACHTVWASRSSAGCIAACLSGAPHKGFLNACLKAQSDMHAAGIFQSFLCATQKPQTDPFHFRFFAWLLPACLSLLCAAIPVLCKFFPVCPVSVQWLHDRMPVILSDRAAMEGWLGSPLPSSCIIQLYRHLGAEEH